MGTAPARPLALTLGEAAGIGPDEGRFLAAVEHVNPGLAKAA